MSKSADNVIRNAFITIGHNAMQPIVTSSALSIEEKEESIKYCSQVIKEISEHIVYTLPSTSNGETEIKHVRKVLTCVKNASLFLNSDGENSKITEDVKMCCMSLTINSNHNYMVEDCKKSAGTYVDALAMLKKSLKNHNNIYDKVMKIIFSKYSVNKGFYLIVGAVLASAAIAGAVVASSVIHNRKMEQAKKLKTSQNVKNLGKALMKESVVWTGAALKTGVQIVKSSAQVLVDVSAFLTKTIIQAVAQPRAVNINLARW